MLTDGRVLVMVMVGGDMGEVREIAGVEEMKGTGLVIEEAGEREVSG